MLQRLSNFSMSTCLNGVALFVSLTAVTGLAILVGGPSVPLYAQLQRWLEAVLV